MPLLIYLNHYKRYKVRPDDEDLAKEKKFRISEIWLRVKDNFFTINRIAKGE